MDTKVDMSDGDIVIKEMDCTLMESSDARRMQMESLLSEAVTSMCKNMLNYSMELSVEGLLGITLDRKEVVLVNIKQMVLNPDSFVHRNPVRKKRKSSRTNRITARLATTPDSSGRGKAHSYSDGVCEDRAPGDRAPADRAPADRAPGDRAPGDRAPADRAPGDRAPGDRAPGDRAPGDRPPGDRAPGDRVIIKDEPDMECEILDEPPSVGKGLLSDVTERANNTGPDLTGHVTTTMTTMAATVSQQDEEGLNLIQSLKRKACRNLENEAAAPCDSKTLGSRDIAQNPPAVIDPEVPSDNEQYLPDVQKEEFNLDGSLQSVFSTSLDSASLSDIERAGGGKFLCPYCPRAFSHKRSLWRHMRSHSIASRVSCDVCGKSFGRRDTLLRHIDVRHNTAKLKCPHCDKTFSREESVQRHLLQCHAAGGSDVSGFLQGVDVSEDMDDVSADGGVGVSFSLPDRHRSVCGANGDT